MRVELGWTDLATLLGGGGGGGGFDDDTNTNNNDVPHGEAFFNPLAGLISILSVVVLACGVQESKRVTNFFTVTKVLLVLFMIAGGFCLFQPQNMTPLIPPALGATGVIRGATSSFFGYLGFDEVCCLANEAKNPSDMPKAVLWTLAIVTVIYVLASIALCGMQNYEHISDTSGFPAAFADRGVEWAAQLTAAGEVLTLPVVVLISLLAQPRLFAAVAKDGLMPAIFARQDDGGNLFWGSILCGVPMTLLATFVPFSWMDDAISVGILFAFNMTNTALILMRCNRHVTHLIQEDGDYSDYEGEGFVASSSSHHVFYQQQRGYHLPANLFCYHAVALMAGLTSHLSLAHDSSFRDFLTWTAQIVAAACALLYAVYIHRKFPSTGHFGYSSLNWQRRNSEGTTTEHETEGSNGNVSEEKPFGVPLVPVLPLVGIFLNWYLISQLDWSGILLLLLFLGIMSALYFACINGNHRHHNTAHFSREYNIVRGHEAMDGPVLLREMSLPKR
jgi:amino acid transporter